MSPIYSTYADDEMMCELIEMFVDEIPDRIDTLRSAYEANDRESLKRTAHQLKGAFGSYGFGCMTEPARDLEQSAGDESCPLERIEACLNILISESERLSAGQPQQ